MRQQRKWEPEDNTNHDKEVESNLINWWSLKELQETKAMVESCRCVEILCMDNQHA